MARISEALESDGVVVEMQVGIRTVLLLCLHRRVGSQLQYVDSSTTISVDRVGVSPYLPTLTALAVIVLVALGIHPPLWQLLWFFELAPVPISTPALLVPHTIIAHLRAILFSKL